MTSRAITGFVVLLFSFSVLLNIYFLLKYQKTFSERPREEIKGDFDLVSPTPEGSRVLSESDKGSDLVLVTKVIDGDTIVLETGETVRYIGIDTPETTKGKNDCYGNEANNRNRELVQGKRVKLEKDVSEKDRFGRLLRYVYVGGVFVNDILVREGYANASSYPPDIKYQASFSESARIARESKVGLWEACEINKTSENTEDKDCKDFKTQKDSQDFFVSQGGPLKDPHKLDSDGDGKVCESLP